MQVHQELPAQPPTKETVLTIGVFDGVHLGHQRLLKHLKDTASRNGMLSGVLTFTNHPRTVLAPNTRIQYISTVKERLALLENSGVDMVIPLTFDQELSRLTALEFVSLLRERLRMAELVIGPNFAMGRAREGSAAMLHALGKENGFSVTVVEPVLINGDRVSSTAIREAISAGNMTRASQHLGRHFALRGIVLQGDARGRTLGFPTANVDVPKEIILPGDGCYATWAHVDGNRHMAATNIGIRPTFKEKKRTIETFLLDFTGDLYGSEITVEFAERLRDEMRFNTPEDLVAQIHRDVEQTRTILNQTPNPVQLAI